MDRANDIIVEQGSSLATAARIGDESQIADVAANVMEARWDRIPHAARLYNHAVLQVYMSDGWS